MPSSQFVSWVEAEVDLYKGERVILVMFVKSHDIFATVRETRYHAQHFRDKTIDDKMVVLYHECCFLNCAK